MSGIAAIYGPMAKEKAYVLDQMLTRLKHRGPHGKHVFTRGQVALGHQTLRLNPNEHEQPLVTEDKMMVLASDAEIFNKEEIFGVQECDAVHHSDAQAITRAYRLFGPACLSKLDGVFSFVVYDNGQLFAARDPLGALPLYWGKLDGQLIFASELKALVGIAEKIEEFPPGHFYHSVSGLNKYYHLPSDPPSTKNAEAAAQELKYLLKAAVLRRIQAGVPTGVFLSGGLDSSVIAALAKPHCEGLKAFTVSTKSGEDLPFARQMAKHLNLELEEYIYNIDEVVNVLPKVIYHLESFDAPLVRSAIPNYLVSRLAKDKIDIVLIGEGGDENFGGYHHLKQLDSRLKQHNAFLKLFDGLHNNGFMRTDRMNAAHSLVVRTPFFDTEVVNFALSLDPDLKIHGKEKVEKWILRKAFEDSLPKEIVWRPKKQFARGCGSDDMLTNFAEKTISDEMFEKKKAHYPSVDLRCKEELLYFEIFKEHFGDDPSVISTVGQWYE